MKFAISNIAWKKHENNKIYELMIDNGFYGLEIAPSLFVGNKSPYDLNDDLLITLRKKIEKYGITLVSMQSILFGTNNLHLFYSKESRKELSNYVKKAIDFASCLGISNIVFGSPKNRIVPNRMNSEEVKEISLSFFSDLGDYAFNNKTCIGLEANASDYGGNWMTDTLKTIAFIKEVDSKGIKLNLDMGTIRLNNESEKVFTQALPIINHIHISEPFLKPLPQNIEFHKKIAKSMKSTDYKGYLSIEMKSVGEDNFRNVKRAIEFVNKEYR